MKLRHFLIAVLTIAGLNLALCDLIGCVADEIQPDFLMDSDPPLQIPQSVVYFHPNLKSLLITALQRPEADMQRMSAETIARTHELGLQGLNEATPQLEKIVEAEGSHPAARFAAARALIVLNSEASADKLFSASQAHGADLRQLVEPALAKWNHPGARAKWLDRLSSKQTTHRDLVLAIRGLGEVRDATASPVLLVLVNNLTREPDLRLEAATAAGKISDSGLETAASKLAGDNRSAAFVNQLCAIRLLGQQDSDESKSLLVELAAHQEPVVAAAALTRLNEIDSNLVLPMAKSALENPDARVRSQGIMAFLNLPTADGIASAGILLTDPNPSIRMQVLEGFVRLSQQPELAESIQSAAMNALTESKRQREAALLVGTLDHKPAAARLVELLDAESSKVQIAAAWALRKLAVAETAAPVLAIAQQLTERRRSENVEGLDEQCAHLLEALAVLRTVDAEPLLRRYVPKDFYSGDLSRGAAIWALGHIKEGTRDEELENDLASRIRDFADQNPETVRVKQMSTVALARMKAVDQADLLKGMSDRMARPVSLAASLRWAVKELTGEELPPSQPDTISPGTWFLEPVE